jgi:hypothetical protein
MTLRNNLHQAVVGFFPSPEEIENNSGALRGTEYITMQIQRVRIQGTLPSNKLNLFLAIVGVADPKR